MTDETKPTLLDILNELATYIDQNETPKETAMIVLGFAMGIAVRAGWRFHELAALRLWPRPE